jgi:hypothetical protein
MLVVGVPGDRIKLLGKGLRIGRISKWLSPPGYGGCLCCQTTWYWVEEHITRYSPNDGCLPLCRKCWEQLPPAERLPYYRKLWDSWWRDKRDEKDMEDVWVQLETAVMLGK